MASPIPRLPPLMNIFFMAQSYIHPIRDSTTPCISCKFAKLLFKPLSTQASYPSGMKRPLHYRDLKVAGIFAWTPLVCLVIYLILAMTVYRDGLPSERSSYDADGNSIRLEEEAFFLLVGFFILKWVLFFFSLITMKFFTLNHLGHHHTPGKGEKTFWIIAIMLLGVVFIPIYHLSVMRKTPDLYQENPPLFNFDTPEP